MTWPGGGEVATPANTTVGVVGIGDMGGGIARSILRAGFPVVVFDLRRDAVDSLISAGAKAAPTLAALADTCDVVSVVVVDDKQVQTVVGTFLRAPGRLRTIIVNSTVVPRTVVQLNDKAQTAGLGLVDAPVSGGGEKSALGTLSVIVGAEAEVLEQCRPVLEAFGSNLFHVGPVGAGSAGKLVNNLLSLGTHVLQLEAMQLADAYGISEDAATEFITASQGDSRGIRTWGRIDRIRRTHTLAGTPAMYEIFAKDLRCAAIAAGDRGVTLPATGVIAELIGPKMAARDELLRSRPDPGPSPRCRTCDQELAKPFRVAGTHPECRT
jgi:3-hydroxyisobutyrate dehydrogenase